MDEKNNFSVPLGFSPYKTTSTMHSIEGLIHHRSSISSTNCFIFLFSFAVLAATVAAAAEPFQYNVVVYRDVPHPADGGDDDAVEGGGWTVARALAPGATVSFAVHPVHHHRHSPAAAAPAAAAAGKWLLLVENI
jgi:hypothetical protein